jgi:hypothetical protein
MARGIEVFGRNATVVEFGPADRARHTPALGGGAALIAVAAAVALIAAVVERSRGSDLVDLLTWIALGASAAAVLMGLFALVTGRGRIPGLIAVVVGALANPWLLTQLLTWAAGFVE